MGSLYDLSFSAYVQRRVTAFCRARLESATSLKASPSQIEFLALDERMTYDDAWKEIAKRGYRFATFSEMNTLTKKIGSDVVRRAADVAGPGPIISLLLNNKTWLTFTLNCDKLGHVIEFLDCTHFPNLSETDVLAVVKF